MILCNIEVQHALDNGLLIIEPQPLPRKPEIAGGHCPWDTHTVDLRLRAEIQVPIPESIANIDLSGPSKVAKFIERNCDTITITATQPYILQPGKLVLAQTMESVGLPIPKRGKACLAARIEGKSSRARFGLLIHCTAPTVHPGWEVGPLTLEMINLGAWPMQLTLGMAIAQLIVEEVSGIPFANPSQFQGQATPAGVVKDKPQAIRPNDTPKSARTKSRTAKPRPKKGKSRQR